MKDPTMMNKFDRAFAARRERHEKAAESATQREAKRQAQREAWTNPNRSRQYGASGTAPDAKVLEAKAEWDRERTATQKKTAFAAQPISFSLSQQDMEVIFNAWITRMGSAWYDSELNRHNILNCMALNLHEKRLSGWNLESFQQCFEYLKENGYIETPPVRVRGTAASVAKVFPAYVPAKSTEEIEAERQQAITDELTQRQAEEVQAKKMGFEELSRKVRGGYKRAAKIDGVSHV